MIKNCQHCKIEFTPKRKSKQYCGDRCRVAAHRVKDEPPPVPIWLGKQTQLKEDGLYLACMAARIIDTYSGRVTLRQVYYRMVAANEIPNTKESYDRFGEIIKKARENGIISWEAIEDRGREIAIPMVYDTVREFRKIMRDIYDEDRWSNQQIKLAVIVEKAALAGVIEPICRKWQVPFIASKGFASSTLVAEASTKLRGRIVHYYGDHDPSGLDMIRDWQDRLHNFGAGCVVEAHGLNRDQIEEFNLPPQPVKKDDVRATKYSSLHGNGSWELDAMPPDALENLVEQNIMMYVDPDLWRVRRIEIEENRRLL